MVEFNRFSDDEMRRYCKERGVIPERHCCVELAFAVAHPLETPHQGPNRVVDWIASWNEYRIPVAYDGYSSTEMRFCPFCGVRLPKSLRDVWYERLYAKGYGDPDEDEIPSEYESDAWWRGDSTTLVF